MALLEVVALHAADAERAEAGGADRVEVRGALGADALSPEPAVVAKVRAATSVQVRVLVRLRAGFGTDGGEATRLRGLIASYLGAGADGLAFGFLNGLGEVDGEVIGALTEDGDWPWTFHRALDYCLDGDKAWTALRRLPRCDQVLTAGSARGVEHGLDELVRRARSDEWAAARILAGVGLAPEHVPWLARAGVRAFHVGACVRPSGTERAYVDEAQVRSWRTLIDAECRRVR